MKTRIVDIDWPQCEKTGAYTFFTDTNHVIRIKKQSIPIYKAKGPFLRLVLHPELLNPGGTERSDPGKKDATKKSAFDVFGDKVDQAEAFHDTLGLRQHYKTAFSYVTGGLSTYDSVQYYYDRDQSGPRYAGKAGIIEDLPHDGSGTDLDQTKTPHAFYTLANSTGTGDGTVPHSSGSALKSSFYVPPLVNGVEHSAFYDNAVVKHFTVGSIAKIADDYRKTQI